MSAVRLPGSLETNRRLGQWLRFRPEGFVEVRSGKVEIGQGITSALAQIVADELDVPFERIRMIPPSTAESPREGVTSGSLSVQDSGTALRHACAEARDIYLASAAEKLGAPRESLEVSAGEIIAKDGKRTSYWALADDRLLDREATGAVQPKDPAQRHLIGRSPARLDIPDKVLGRPRFVHDLEMPGLMHGRVLRPASVDAKLVSLDMARARSIAGVAAVVRDGNFLGVVAEREEVALKALARLRLDATWQQPHSLPDEGALADWLRAQPHETTLVGEKPP
ncbi:MAG TPA: molybdopterin cofactor-binding domain-containing protein, partial [Usitatibacter sp.]|nr:molybdopterin cofactor-binding domain-containing protein [Usitatibacter sp.]